MADDVITRPAGGRRLAVQIHEQVRELILDGTLAPGTFVAQAELARRFGVSRTPMREAFRMLQEEGLIEASPDHRGRVRELDPVHLDQMYGSRVLLEALGIAVTLPHMADADFAVMRGFLDSMAAHAEAQEWAEWQQVHRTFHGMHSGEIGGQIQQMMGVLAEHSTRFVLQNRMRRSDSPARAHAEHLAIVEALESRDVQAAIEAIARHLASTALTTLADVAPEYEPVCVRTSLRLVLKK